jgi:protein-S-isoprenylcysteine O-methyltransferase Ste14
MGSGVRIGLAVTVFAVIHSLLASRSAKDRAVRLVGARGRNGHYRVFFNAQAIVTTAGLVWYCARLPDRPLWRAPKPLGLVFNAIRFGILAAMYSATRQVGLARISGLHSMAAWSRGDENIPAEPEAQGPALDRPIAGPFRFTRHPLNLLSIPLLWLAPSVSRNRFVFNSAATLYFLLGSLHEEARLCRANPESYRAYQQQVRFLVGKPGNRIPWASLPV